MLYAFRRWRLTNILSSLYDVILYRVVVVMVVVGARGVRQPLSLRQAVSHQSRLAGCSEQQQQHRFLSALTETDGRLRC